MSQEIAELKAFVRAFLRQNMEVVPPQNPSSGKVHLEVWRSPIEQPVVWKFRAGVIMHPGIPI